MRVYSLTCQKREVWFQCSSAATGIQTDMYTQQTSDIDNLASTYSLLDFNVVNQILPQAMKFSCITSYMAISNHAPTTLTHRTWTMECDCQRNSKEHIDSYHWATSSDWRQRHRSLPPAPQQPDHPHGAGIHALGDASRRSPPTTMQWCVYGERGGRVSLLLL